MAIPLIKENAEMYNHFRFYESCFFCNSSTNTWHKNTNNPVCRNCSKSHKVIELPNRFKGEKPTKS